MNKLESPSPKDDLCQVWLKLAQWLWRRRFLKFVNVISQFRNYLPLEKGGGLHLNKLEDPSPKDALFQVWLMYVRSLSLSPSLSPFNKVVCIYFTFGKVR